MHRGYPAKSSHTAVAIDAGEVPRGGVRVLACPGQAGQLLAWAQAWPERTWAVEGATGLGHLLAQQLVAAGERVLDIQPKLAARIRVLEAGNTSKNDPNDARSVAVAALRSKTAAETSLAQGRFLNAATAREPVCVLGAAAAQLLGIDHVYAGERIWITLTNASGNPAGGMWLYVSGILKPDVLAPDIDSSVLAGFPFAEKYLLFDGHPSTIYVKAATSQVNRVDSLLGAQANPEDPSGVNVSQPSQALVAQADAKSAFNTPFLGLGAVALLVGAIGVANIMVIAVLERRSEIGLRRALGATRGHIRTQFLTEAVLLALIGGVVGVLAGAAATAIYAHHKGWATVTPADAWAGGLAAALVIGALAGLLPAIRAARLSPTEALWTM